MWKFQKVRCHGRGIHRWNDKARVMVTVCRTLFYPYNALAFDNNLLEYVIVPVNNVVSLTLLLWALWSFRRFTLFSNNSADFGLSGDLSCPVLMLYEETVIVGLDTVDKFKRKLSAFRYLGMEMVLTQRVVLRITLNYYYVMLCYVRLNTVVGRGGTLVQSMPFDRSYRVAGSYPALGAT